ncbi:MAG: DNA/RNA non-specific endonuclease [Chlorobiota bacterium]
MALIILLVLGWIIKADKDYLPEDKIESEITKTEFTYNKNIELPSYSEDITILPKNDFTIGYIKKYKHAAWVAYKLDCEETKGDIGRSHYFREDDILGKYSPSTDDYYASGYDKGHLVPAGDLTTDSLAMDDSFLMSNVSPQIPDFNRGLWKRLESQVRDWACEFDSVFVVTGAVLHDSLTSIGKRKIAVPDHFYKSILVYDDNVQSSLSFLIYQYTKEEKLENFVITTDSLENVIDLDLFHNLPDSTEKSIESKVDHKLWF